MEEERRMADEAERLRQVAEAEQLAREAAELAAVCSRDSLGLRPRKHLGHGANLRHSRLKHRVIK